MMTSTGPQKILDVRNPRTGKTDYRFSPASHAAVGDTASSLRDSQPAWEALGLAARAEAMRQFAEAVNSHREVLLKALMDDTGRSTQSHIEIDAIAPMIERMIQFAEIALTEQPPKVGSHPHLIARTQLVPFQLAGVISPWNFPLLLAMMDSIPALLAGCAVLFKPSEVTPRHAEVLATCFGNVPVLRDVAGIVCGTGATGAAVVDSVDVVCFTGSVPTGRLVAEQAARNFIPAFLEMGGKDPAIVLESADLDRATTILLRASVAATGQACQSVERIYVARPILEEFVDRIVQKATEVRLNCSDIRHGQLGPLILTDQATIIAAHVADAVEKGATVRCGGKVIENGGLWYPPTVLTDVTHAMMIMQEETFGPVMPVMAFDTVDDVVKLANDSQYGLSANVFAGSEYEALEVAHRLTAGVISINEASLSNMVYEFEQEPFKFSGLGRSRMGQTAVERFCRKKLILTDNCPEPRGLRP